MSSIATIEQTNRIASKTNFYSNATTDISLDKSSTKGPSLSKNVPIRLLSSLRVGEKMISRQKSSTFNPRFGLNPIINKPGD